ncbi:MULTISPECIES: sugar O-acetyltransferase [Sphingobacterium]|uniref:Acetyltransferase n=1 Tax=Sphingobacterium populi TaxID=1812824 RepID=A0ABW5U8Q5_9SPHI|nr:sugar O-acetyltransferase [Sphingobacterium sp. CFCC 11742]
MKTAKEKMIAGEPYRADGRELFDERQKAKEVLMEYNSLLPNRIKDRARIIKDLFGKTGKAFWIEPPFRCDYGYNIEIGENFYANFNLTILDCALVSIGKNVLFGPNVSLFTAGHPIHAEPRAAGWEYALPIYIGDSCWIGGNTVINAGVTIGENTVIGSGSVVTKSVPANVVAAGNPCRVIKTITEADKDYYYKDRKF